MRFQRGLAQVGCESSLAVEQLAQQPGSPYPGLNSQCLILGMKSASKPGKHASLSHALFIVSQV